MTAPAVAEYTQRLWDGLPELYRAGDQAQPDGPSGWPLLRFLSLIGDQAGLVEDLLDRLKLHQGVDGVWTSDLADPLTADDAWLPWMAQFAGVQVDLGSSLAESYAQLLIDFDDYSAIAAEVTNYAQLRQHGSDVGAGIGPDQLRQALADSVQARLAGSTGYYDRLLEPYLTGARRVLHRRVFGGDPWALRLETYVSETPDPVTVAAVVSRAEHPAGLVVTYATRTGSSYAEVRAHFATYAAVTSAFATYTALSTWIP